MENFWRNLFTVFPINYRRRVYQQILEQRSLAKKGELAKAEIIDKVLEGRQIYNYVKIKVDLKLRKENKTQFCRLNTLINKDNIPQIGKIVTIRCCLGSELNTFLVEN